MDNLKPVRVNRNRLETNLQALAVYGHNGPSKGITRPFGSQADKEARAWLSTLWSRHLELQVHTDPIANLWVTIEGKENLPAIVVGSHHDTVTNGGMYDGAMGVLLATEVLQTIQEHGIQLRHPLKAVSFSGEEPNSFNVSTLGSKVATGKLSTEDLFEKRDNKGTVLFRETLHELGGDVGLLTNAIITNQEIGAFLECHIEQGKKLESKGLSLGVVTKIIGIYREKIIVIGEANHAGTTLMHHRYDALTAASELLLVAEKAIVACKSDEVVGTVGYLQVEPNSTNIIPGQVEFILEIRAVDSPYKERIIKEITKGFNEVAARRKVEVQREVILDQAPKPMNAELMQALEHGANQIGEQVARLISMAGHDAANVSDVTRSAMLFVSSVNGKSHCPDEFSRIEDIAKAGNALLEAVLYLDRKLD